MPIYEYECTACRHRTEVLQGVNEPALSECPECGRSALTKLMSAAGFRLAGKGWYETDFKTGNKRNLVGDNAGSDRGGSGEKSKNAETGKGTDSKKTAGASGTVGGSESKSSGKPTAAASSSKS